MRSKLKRGFAPILIILVIAAVIAVLVLVFKFISSGGFEGSPFLTVNSDSQVSDLKTLGVSDEVSAIETDLNKTNLEKINQEMPQVEKEASTGL